MNRYLTETIEKYITKKMVFVAGPRQTGKTTMALSLEPHAPFSHYLNWDDPVDREDILSRTFPTEAKRIILDEIHKYLRWRAYLKGLFDKKKDTLQILVTGSAKLDHYRRGGDSLQGRYFLARLHPLSIAELKNFSKHTWTELSELSGFPEPFFGKNQAEARIWSRTYRSRVIREELVQLEKVQEVSLLELLAQRLPDCVGSPLSLNSLRKDLNVAHKTVARWMDHLENLYFLFRVYPFGSPKIRAVKHEPKHYHFDWTQVKDPGARFENMVACHLLKWAHWVEDTQGYEMELRYFRDEERREVDFVLLQDRKPILFVECKLSDVSISKHLIYLKNKFPAVETVQLVQETDIDKLNHELGIRIATAWKFLSGLI